MEFVLSDESINAYGFRVLTSGIKLDSFKQNPVMLWNHERYNKLPIGRWDGVKKVDGKLVGTAVLDESDEFALKIKNKLQNKILNACSIGISIKAISDNPNDMVAGQTRPTVTQAELVEVSIVDIPANKNALRLYSENEKGELVALNLGDQEGIDEVLARFKAPEQEKETTEKQKDPFGEAMERMTSLMTENMEGIKKVFDQSIQEIKKALEEKKPASLSAEEIIALVNKSETAEKTLSAKEKVEANPDWSYLDWYKNDHKTLMAYKEEDPEGYKALKGN